MQALDRTDAEAGADSWCLLSLLSGRLGLGLGRHRFVEEPPIQVAIFLKRPSSSRDENRANPARELDKHYERKKHRKWELDEQQQFLEGNERCNEPANDRERLAFMLALHTGFRLGDICALKWDDYKPKHANGPMLIVKATEKTGTFVVMPVDPDGELFKLLAKTPRVSDYILTNTLGKRYCKDSVSGLFTERLRKLGIKGRVLHGLRKTFAVHCIENGVPMENLKTLLGHKRIQQSDEYAEDVNIELMNREAFKIMRNRTKAKVVNSLRWLTIGCLRSILSARLPKPVA
jgi:integrase